MEIILILDVEILSSSHRGSKVLRFGGGGGGVIFKLYFKLNKSFSFFISDSNDI